MMAEVRVNPNPNGAYDIELWKGTRRLKSTRFTKGEWEDLKVEIKKVES